MTQICQFEGCTKIVWATGLCRHHYSKKWWATNLKSNRRKSRIRAKKQHKKNPEKFRLRTKLWHANHPEHDTVANHYRFIFHRNLPAYKNMPFFDAWNPDKGGSIKTGGQWIIENLGRRPSKRYELHVVDRLIGFVPGNLRWVPKERHYQEELINRLLLENQNLRKENEILRASK